MGTSDCMLGINSIAQSEMIGLLLLSLDIYH